jgi:hypothetical protein
MAKPLKRSGWNQGIHAISATAKETVGALRILDDGRKFRYAKAGASALSAGKANAAAAVAAGVMNEACASAHAIGEYVITETITAGVAYTQDHFAGGFLQVNDATGEGHQYKITSSSAVTAAGTSITIVLEDPIRVALVAATSEFTLTPSPQQMVVETTTEENLPTGVAPVAVTAAYYFWNQTGGHALALIAGTPAVGEVLTLSGTSGALTGITTPLDVDIAYQAGILWGTAGVATEYKPVWLTLD